MIADHKVYNRLLQKFSVFLLTFYTQQFNLLLKFARKTGTTKATAYTVLP